MAPHSHPFLYKGTRYSNNVLSNEKAKTDEDEKQLNRNSLTMQVTF